MKKKLQSIKQESQQLCSEVSSTLRTQASSLEKTATPPFKSLDDFDRWFNSDEPLRL